MSPIEKRSVGKGQIIHTSLKEMTSIQSDFPNSNPTPGVLARAAYHRGKGCTVVEVYYESPIVISPGKGEFVDADPKLVDKTVRKKILEISEACRLQGEELLAHAERLMNIAMESTIIDEIKQQSSEESFSVIGMEPEIKRKREKTPKRDKSSELLEMLEDDEEESEQEESAEVEKESLLDMLMDEDED